MKGKVLIVEDDADTRRALQLRVQAEGYEAVVAADGATGLQAAQHARPNVILLDLGLPAGGGLVFLQRIKQMVPLAGIPVIVVSALDPAVHRERALAHGAVAYLPKPLDNRELSKLIARFVSRQAGERAKAGKILVLEDDDNTRRGLCLRLQSSGYSTAEAADSITGVSAAMRERPDLVLLDLGLPGGDGFQFIERIRIHPELSETPIVVLSARFSEANKERAKQAGVKAFLAKPPDNRILLDTIRKALGQP